MSETENGYAQKADMQEVKQMTFDEALKELESIVKKIEKGDETLDNAIASFKRGSELKQHCQSILDNAKLTIEKIVQDSEAELKTQKIDI